MEDIQIIIKYLFLKSLIVIYILIIFGNSLYLFKKNENINRN